MIKKESIYMRKNVFLYTLLIVGLMSCNLGSKSLDSKEGGIKKDFAEAKAADKVVNGGGGNLQGDEASKEGNVDALRGGIVNDVQGDEAKEDNEVGEKEKLVAELKKETEDFMGLVKKYKTEVEDGDQYGMKNEVFKAVTDTSNNKTLDGDENKEARRLFYSSLEYDKDKIKELAKILKKIETDNDNKGTWVKDIINSGREHVQSNFEKVVNKLEESKAKLEKLSLDDLKEVKTKFDELKTQREDFKKAVDSLLASYKAKTDGIDSDSKKLIEHVEKEYKDLITVKLPGMKAVSDKIMNTVN
ncbi:complement regulator-acquiring protein [Borrelia miyamotoi]|nr:complement regulator-acquiring protein [Borrelia miyamotoi]